MGATSCANFYPAIYIYCTEVRLSFCDVEVNGPLPKSWGALIVVPGENPRYPVQKGVSQI